MTPTPFNDDGSLDEGSLRQHLRRLVGAGLALYLSSGGAGEAHVLSVEEMRRICSIGVEVGDGKVPVYAGLRESRSAEAMYAIALPAIQAGVDAVQLYQLDNGHGMIPTPDEQELYWRTLLDEIDHPVAISIHYDAKFRAPVSMLAALTREYPQIVAFSLVNSAPSYFVQLRDAVSDRIAFHVALPELVQFTALGAAAGINPIGNLIPFTCRQLALALRDNDRAAVSSAALTIQRMLTIVGRWAPSTARWVKMGMKVLGTGNGVLRPPYLLPPEPDQAAMARAFQELDVAQREAEARTYVEART